jgi:hypothetical protein
MYMRLIATILSALSCDAFAAADLYDAVDRLRAGEGEYAIAQEPAPLARELFQEFPVLSEA